MIALRDAVLELAPKCAAVYLDSLVLNADLLASKGITANTLRTAHWLAQGLEETGGGEIIRESGAYSAARLVEVFGPGKSSAAIGPAEAATLAENGPAIFERVYGTGNPRLERELGNTQPGDGWAYRGNMWFQTTGRAAHHLFGTRLGVSFEATPGAMNDPKYAVGPAILEWDDGALNTQADLNDLRAITRKINGGYNGYADRLAWFDKAYALLKKPDEAAAAWQQAPSSSSTLAMQESLNALGYTPALTADGRYGPATHEAVEWFQKIHGLTADGACGPVTSAAINLAFAAGRGA